jgi:hypothetical protein
MVRFAGLLPLFVAVMFLGRPAVAGAQEPGQLVIPSGFDIAPVQGRVLPPPEAISVSRAPEQRPKSLLPLYASFATLQVLDFHSTRYALDRGAAEGNPLLKGVATNDVGLLALKAAGTAGVIFASERMWTKNKTAAVLFMIASNSAMAWVVQHNYRVVR